LNRPTFITTSYAIATSLDDAKHPAFIRRYVARSLPGLREHLKETILNVVRENLQPEDHAAFQELFSRVWKIVADQRKQIVESKVDLRRKSDLARANKMLADVDRFEKLAAEYEREIFKLFAENPKRNKERIQWTH